MLFVIVLIGVNAWFSVVLMLAVTGVCVGLYLVRRINGYNGDTLGASEQIAELLVLFTLLGWQA